MSDTRNDAEQLLEEPMMLIKNVLLKYETACVEGWKDALAAWKEQYRILSVRTLNAEEELRAAKERIETLEQLNVDAFEDDRYIRNIAKKVLNEYQCEGDSYAVPGICDIVDMLVESHGHLAAKLAECEKDTERLAYAYSGAKTSSDALVQIELRLLNGDIPTIEEVRAAIDSAKDKA